MENEVELNEFLDDWKIDPINAKTAFLAFNDFFVDKPKLTKKFISRPGISRSLRVYTPKRADGTDIVVLIDVIDDDVDNRWLSICFFQHLITDPQELGDFVPQGLEGRDALCFNFDEDNPAQIDYILERIKEAATA